MPETVQKKGNLPPQQRAKPPAQPRRPAQTPATTLKKENIAGQRRATGQPKRVAETPRPTPREENLPPEQRAKAQARRATETTPTTQMFAGKRDPFKLPPPPGTKGAEGISESAAGPMPPGARGLIISQLRLQGVVREEVSNKMIAVVTNETRRAYFLKDNDAVYNGVVSKITPDALYFKENVLDPNGRVSTREVVKRLGSAPGEGR
jgi:hypothetical protein